MASKQKKRTRTLTVEDRRKAKKTHLTRPQKQIIAAACVIVLLFSFTYIRKIVNLKIQQKELIKQQEQLVAERDRLKAKLKNVNNSEYIAEQARKQLRLVNPDEILFVFDDDEEK